MKDDSVVTFTTNPHFKKDIPALRLNTVKLSEIFANKTETIRQHKIQISA